MMEVESYRQFAADCVRQAQGEATPEDKNILLNVALAWLRLAQQTQALSETESPTIQPDQDETAPSPPEDVSADADAS